jgi:hypothetical protein
MKKLKNEQNILALIPVIVFVLVTSVGSPLADAAQNVPRHVYRRHVLL